LADKKERRRNQMPSQPIKDKAKLLSFFLNHKLERVKSQVELQQQKPNQGEKRLSFLLSFISSSSLFITPNTNEEEEDGKLFPSFDELSSLLN